MGVVLVAGICLASNSGFVPAFALSFAFRCREFLPKETPIRITMQINIRVISLKRKVISSLKRLNHSTNLQIF
jgi:hypothetical protein